MKILGPAFCLAILLTGAWTHAAGAEAVVVASTAPGLAKGKVLADADALEVPEGAAVTFLLPSGRIVEVAGPYEGPVDWTRLEKPTGIADWRAATGVDVAAIGGTRAVAVADVDGGPLVAADEPGTWCMRPGHRPRLQRAGDAARTTVTDLATGAAETIVWRPEERARDWPTTLPPRDGSRFRLQSAPGGASVTVAFRASDSIPESPRAWTAWMAKAGCAAQAEADLEEIAGRVARLGLFLTTDRGRSPVYRPGETIRIVLQANRPAWVYCFVEAGSGEVVPIFPNGWSGGAFVPDHEPLHLPGERLPQGLVAAHPAGEDAVRCWGLDRDATSELAALVPAAFAPLPPEAARRLDETFRSLGAEVATSEVSIRVE